MKKRSIFLYILALTLMLSLVGCRSKVKQTESETQSETQTEIRTEPVTEKETQKAAVKTASETEKTDPSKKTTVKPSASGTDKTKKNQPSTNKKPATAGTTPQNTQTQMCPYCYNQISTAPNGDGTTIYSQHVAQEKAWADTYGWGNNPPATEAPQTNATEAPAPSAEPANNVAQCPYCYQWFTISDGTYNAHVNSETASLGLPQGSDYVTCPDCGNTYRRGIEYDTHYCTGAIN